MTQIIPVEILRKLGIDVTSDLNVQEQNSHSAEIGEFLSNPEDLLVGDAFVPSECNKTNNSVPKKDNGPSAKKSDSKRLPDGKPVSTNFCKSTNKSNSERYEHTCSYMDIAQNYLGIYKTKIKSKSRKVTAALVQQTQLKYTQQFDLEDWEPWCAAAVTSILLEAGYKDLPGIVGGIVVDTDKRPTDRACVNVQGYIDWADDKNIYHRWNQEDNKNKNEKLKHQLENMHQGDLVVWKNGISHIGFIEFVNVETGDITFIAGNNSDDNKTNIGLVRKTFNIYKSGGYSGYINMTQVS